MPSPPSRALRLMRKLDAATAGMPQHWKTLDELGAVQADAAAIIYAVEKGWLLVAPKHDPHSASLTEEGRAMLRTSAPADRPRARRRVPVRRRAP